MLTAKDAKGISNVNKNAKKFALGTIIAAAAGYVTGILTAPKSGKETRDDVKNAAVKAKMEAEKTLKQLHSDLNTQLARAKKTALNLEAKGKDELNSIVNKASTAKEKAKEMLTAIHEGDVEDKDLKSAIKDVTQAVNHLKAYLDKND